MATETWPCITRDDDTSSTAACRGGIGVGIRQGENGMNGRERKQLQDGMDDCVERIVAIVSGLTGKVEEAMASEERKMDNIPESLQDSRTAESIGECVEALEEALANIEEFLDAVEDFRESFVFSKV
jgi:hypothetical protein